MATKRSKGSIQSIVDAIGELLRQPLSDESNEVPTAGAVRRAKRVAAGPRRGKAVKKTKAKAKKGVAKKRTTSKKAKPKARKKKR
jgi:hypothetical protein